MVDESDEQLCCWVFVELPTDWDLCGGGGAISDDNSVGGSDEPVGGEPNVVNGWSEPLGEGGNM